MKLLDDYTGAELETLSDEQVEKLVNLECADAGVPFAPDPPDTYVPPPQEYDVTLYSVGKTGIMSLSRETAESISEFLKKLTLWKVEANWRHGYNQAATPMDDDMDVAKVQAYSESALGKRSEALKRAKEDKDQAEKVQKEYADVIDRRGKIADSVWSVIHSARRFSYQRDECIRQLDHCVELADGDATIGMRFFEKSYGGYRTYFTAEAGKDGLVLVRNRFSRD